MRNNLSLCKSFGNVNDESAFTFEFQVVGEIKRKMLIKVAISYKDMQGNKMLLVHTEIFEVSENHDDVIENADFEVFARNVQL